MQIIANVVALSSIVIAMSIALSAAFLMIAVDKRADRGVVDTGIKAVLFHSFTAWIVPIFIAMLVIIAGHFTSNAIHPGTWV